MTFIISMPPSILCLIARATGINKTINQICWALACLFWVFETYRQSQYVGWLIPRNAIIYYKYAVLNGYIREVPAIDRLTVVLACAFIGTAASRGHWKRPREEPKEGINFDSIFGSVWE